MLISRSIAESVVAMEPPTLHPVVCAAVGQDASHHQSCLLGAGAGTVPEAELEIANSSAQQKYTVHIAGRTGDTTSPPLF
jgi:hypothetical protein